MRAQNNGACEEEVKINLFAAAAAARRRDDHLLHRHTIVEISPADSGAL